MNRKTRRLENAERKYTEELQEWLTNPKNEALPDEIIKMKLEAAFEEMVKELLLNEDECAEFISVGGRMDEMDYLKIVFDHFGSRKIYEAIKTNCEVASSCKFGTESKEMQQQRKELISYMEQVWFMV